MNAPELRDIHLPDTSLWWPPAPGWWLLVGLLVLTLAAWVLIRWHRLHRPLKSSSLQELRQIREAYRAGANDRETLAEIAALLRRVVISFRGREQVAASTGSRWVEQLTALGSSQGFSEPQLEWIARHRYRREVDCDVAELLAASERWIRGLPGVRRVSD